MVLTSQQAFNLFTGEFNEIAKEFLNGDTVAPQSRPEQLSENVSFIYGYPILATIFILCISLFIGAVDIENEISPALFLTSLSLTAILICLLVLKKIESRRSRFERALRAMRLSNFLNKIDFSRVQYDTLCEPVSEDMSTQLGMRDDKVVNIPRLLLVKGDTILLRPGQAAPILCQDSSGRKYPMGERPQRCVEKEEYTDAAIPFKPIKCTILESTIRSHLHTVLSAPTHETVLDIQIRILVHKYLSFWIIPVAVVLSVALAIGRFMYAEEDSLFGTRFIFVVPSCIVVPLICPIFPIFYFGVMNWNNAAVFSYVDVYSTESHSLFYDVVRRCTVMKMFIKALFGDVKFIGKDLVAVLGNLTGVSFVDKKGILSSPNPQLDKIFFFREQENGDIDSDSVLVSEVLDLSTEMTPSGEWKVDFDDPNWRRFERSLAPIAQNCMLNSCSLNDKYNKLLDHVTCVSEYVPRTIAVANRRCVCQLSEIVGFDPSAYQQFGSSRVNTLGLYKRLPGDAPLPGLTKHRTPLETAFCSVHTDERSLHLHLSCQGTAGLILEASSHLWDGSRLRTLGRCQRKSAADFYQRNSMTGYCLALSYRPVGAALSSGLVDKFIEVPLCGRSPTCSGLPRSHSIDSVNQEKFFAIEPLKTADKVLDAYFQGHIFCGMITMQYQAYPLIVQLVDALENDCIRFVYFSRENELRSRVFAEKLGLEAGWNCHVSLAEKENPKSNKTKFLQGNCVSIQRSIRSLHHQLLSKSELSLDLEWEKCVDIKGSPSSRSTSRTSGASSNQKVGPMPNKAMLPTGVDNVRPHLEQVDNVPLQVGLFTDCTSSTIAEMVNIMQEYGEVILVVGSSLNVYDDQVFTQADASICVEPMMGGCSKAPSPHTPEETLKCFVREKKAIYRSGNSLASDQIRIETETTHIVSARQITSDCMSLATDLHLRLEQLAILPDLIAACRHRLFSVRAALLFLLHSSFAIALLSLLSIVLFMPIIFKPDQILLLTLVILPSLSASIISRSFQPSKSIIRIAGKNMDHINRKDIWSAAGTFFVQFLPTICFTIFIYYLLLLHSNDISCSFSDVMCSVRTTERMTNVTSRSERHMEDDLWTEQIRHVVGFMFVIYLVCFSASWVHSLRSIWKAPPIFNLAWVGSAVMSVGIQIIFSKIVLGDWIWDLLNFRSFVVLIGWSVTSLVINEVRKLQLIRLFSREQRRRKLGFDTKLGMNSPY